MQEILKQYPTLHEIVSCTSRPKRENEIDGINYYFHTKDSFEKMIKNNEMLEYTIFNDWYYGTGLESIDKNKINIGVFNPAGVEDLFYNINIDLRIYYIVASDKIRLLRQLNREENPNVNEIVRRYSTDKDDFLTIEDRVQIRYKILNDENNLITDCAEKILIDCDEWMREGTID